MDSKWWSQIESESGETHTYVHLSSPTSGRIVNVKRETPRKPQSNAKTNANKKTRSEIFAKNIQ